MAFKRSRVRFPSAPLIKKEVIASRSSLFCFYGESKQSERRQWRMSGQDVRDSERRGAYAGALRTSATKEAIPFGSTMLHLSGSARHVTLSA